jgi:hypothetical protein
MTDERYLHERLSSEQASSAVPIPRNRTILADFAARHRYRDYDAGSQVEAVAVAVIQKPAL